MVRDYAHRGACGIRRILKLRPPAAIMRRFVYNMLFLHGIFVVKTLWTAVWRQVTPPAAGTGLGDFPMRREKTRRISPVHGLVPSLGRGGGGGSCGQLSRAAPRKGRRERAGKQRTHRGRLRRAGRGGGPAGIRPGPACSLAGAGGIAIPGRRAAVPLPVARRTGSSAWTHAGHDGAGGKGPVALVRRLRPQAVAPGRQTKAPALAGASHLRQTGRCARADGPGPGRRCPPV